MSKILDMVMQAAKEQRATQQENQTVENQTEEQVVTETTEAPEQQNEQEQVVNEQEGGEAVTAEQSEDNQLSDESATVEAQAGEQEAPAETATAEAPVEETATVETEVSEDAVSETAEVEAPAETAEVESETSVEASVEAEAETVVEAEVEAPVEDAVVETETAETPAEDATADSPAETPAEVPAESKCKGCGKVESKCDCADDGFDGSQEQSTETVTETETTEETATAETTETETPAETAEVETAEVTEDVVEETAEVEAPAETAEVTTETAEITETEASAETPTETVVEETAEHGSGSGNPVVEETATVEEPAAETVVEETAVAEVTEEPVAEDETQVKVSTVNLEALGEADSELITPEEIALENAINDVLDTYKAIDTLTMHKTTLKDAMQDGGATPQLFDVMSLAISDQGQYVGKDFTVFNQESIKIPGGRYGVTEEAITSVESMIVSGWEKLSNGFMAVVKTAVEFNKKHTSNTGRFVKKAEALMSMAKSLSGSLPDGAQVNVPVDMFLGTEPASLDDVKKNTELLMTASKDESVNEALAELAKAYAEAKVDDDASAKASDTEIRAKLESVASALEKLFDITKGTDEIKTKLLPNPNEYSTIKATDAFVGNFKIVLGRAGDKTDRVPSVRVVPTDVAAKSKKMPALGREDIMAYAQAAIDIANATVALSQREFAEAPKDLVAGISALEKSLKLNGKELSKETAAMLVERVMQIRGLTKLVSEPYTALSTRLVSVGMGVYNVAYNSAKMHK